MLTLTLHDELNCSLQGLTEKEIERIKERTGIPVKGAYMTAAYQVGAWDGKESFFDDSGIFFQHMLDNVLDILEKELKYNLDSDIKFVDEREEFEFEEMEPVDENYLFDVFNAPLRNHQVKGINLIIENKSGILEYGTSAGKTGICLGISKKFQNQLKTLVVCPNVDLVNQTYETYKKGGVDVAKLNVAPKKRQAVIENHTHIITTSKLLMNCEEFIEAKQFVLIVDEVHQFGDEFAFFLRTNLMNCPVRVGLTGTIPKDKHKAEKIRCHMNADILDIVAAHYLQEQKYAATTLVEMIATEHTDIEELSQERIWDWNKEEAYLGSHPDRIEAIAEYIKSLPITNTLILCHPEMGSNLSKHFNGRMVRDETATDTRQGWYGEFALIDDAFLCASFGCAGTGLSIDRIFRLILIDVGKNETYIKQGIGRGMRLDGVVDHCHVIDIHANTKYSKKHRKDRIKVYTNDKYQYTVSDDVIKVTSS